jgi:DNA-binding MarR family transcriptional regulator
MPDDPIQESISCLIVKVARAHRTLAATLLAELDLYPGQEFLLMQLWREDGLPQSELCARLEVEPPTLTKMLHRLEGCGVVERKRDPVDARICRVHLTDRGYALQEPVEKLWQTLESRTLANLSLEEKLLLRRLLLQLAQNLA